MLTFILRRLYQSVFVMLAVSFIAFTLFRFVGDPVAQMVGQETSIEDRERLRESLGLNDPVHQQFYRFTKNLATAEFGYSYRTRQPIGEMILSRLPATLELGFISLLISLVTNYLTVDGWRSLILPALTLGIYQLTLTMRLVRSEMQDVLKTDYIKFATARGINYRSIYLHHAFRNTLVPVITIIGLQFGGIIAFSIVTESVFQWPGMGLLFLDSIRYVDIPVMSVYLVLIAFIFVLINLLVDILYFVIDPRVRAGDQGS